MLFDRPISRETYAAIRFGMGFPHRDGPSDSDEIIQKLNGNDDIAERIPLFPFSDALALAQAIRAGRKTFRRTKDRAPLETAQKNLRLAYGQTFLDHLIRAVETDDPFRERLQGFWVNHFAARAKNSHLRAAHPGYAADAIRPHLVGHFSEMLKAVVTHPFMLTYLDQIQSIGPNSRVGLKRGTGLNENLAREVLELHTLGVGGGYTQADVREFAELLTGLTADLKRGFAFLPQRAEPGAETILGKSYGGQQKAKLEDIHAALEDIALHPSTGPFLCHKLARHFIADEPDDGLVQHMTATYQSSNGHLGQTYQAMLEHPAAWTGFGAKVKWPIELVATGLRAVGARAEHIQKIGPARARKSLFRPLDRMGQSYARPPGPDGWPDTAGAWVHPHGVAARIGWALGLAKRLPGRLPDPRKFVAAALGDAASDRLIWAASAAESKEAGIALVLASAEFNRR